MVGSQINKLILKSLETGDKYGLEIIKDIENFTKGQVIKQPSLYSALQRLEKKGIISSFWQDSDIGGRRHYYSLTNYGKNELQKIKKQEIEDVSENQNKNIEIFTKPIIKKESIVKNKLFEQYDPNSEFNNAKNSFSQQMRKYIKPENELLVTPSPTLVEDEEDKKVKNSITPTFQFNATSASEPQKSSKNDINYKDILGDLDADLPESNEIKVSNSSIFSEQSPTHFQEEKPKRIQSEYSKQIEKILKSNQTSENQSSINKLNVKQNQNLIEEINRRYKINITPKQIDKHAQIHKIATNSVGYTHIKQENITIKPYSKTENNINTKKFISINKFNLCRSGILTLIFLIELIVSYFLLKEQKMLYQPHEFLFILYGVLGFVYFGVMMLLTLKDLEKKVRIKDINLGMNLFYSFMLTAVLFTFVLSICLCIGMTNPLDIEFFTLWYIPLLAICNILISWIIGVIMYSSKIFRV